MLSHMLQHSMQACLQGHRKCVEGVPRACRLSTENATDSTSLVWPRKRRVVAPVDRSHRRSVPSQLPLSANWPSELITTSWQRDPGLVRRYIHSLCEVCPLAAGAARRLENLLLLSHAPLKAQCRIIHHAAASHSDVAPRHHGNLLQCIDKVHLRVVTHTDVSVLYLDKVGVTAQCAAREAGLPLGIPVQAPHNHRLVPEAPQFSSERCFLSRALKMRGPGAARRPHEHWRATCKLLSEQKGKSKGSP